MFSYINELLSSQYFQCIFAALHSMYQQSSSYIELNFRYTSLKKGITYFRTMRPEYEAHCNIFCIRKNVYVLQYSTRY